MITISVAHSSASVGAVSASGLSEYTVSKAASWAAFRRLTEAGIECQLLDCGAVKPSKYSVSKVARVNKLAPALALEIHCNAADDYTRCYSEVLHHPSGTFGKNAALAVASWLSRGLSSKNHLWPSRGARPNTIAEDKHHDFFIWQIGAPAIIVEGLFLTCPEQAAFLASDGGCEAYGLMVADGVISWMSP